MPQRLMLTFLPILLLAACQPASTLEPAPKHITQEAAPATQQGIYPAPTLIEHQPFVLDTLSRAELSEVTACNYPRNDPPHDDYAARLVCREGPVLEMRTEIGCEVLIAPLEVWQGLSAGTAIVARCDREEWLLPDEEQSNGFHNSGIDSEYQVSYILYHDGQFVHVRSAAMLRDLFAPVSSQIEALSFAALVTGHLPAYDLESPTDEFDYIVPRIEETHVRETPHGYLVRLFDWRIAGCSPFEFHFINVQVDEEGRVADGIDVPFARAHGEDEGCI